MMYIEQAPLGGNLLKFLKNSASLSNGTVTKDRATAAVNGKSSILNEHSLLYLKSLKGIDKPSFKIHERQHDQLATENEEEEEDEHEHYELIDVIDDTDKAEIRKSKHEANLHNGYNIELIIDDVLNDTSLRLNDDSDHNEAYDSESEGYEYRLVRVPKRRSRVQRKKDSNFILEHEKQRRPVPAAIPINQFRKHQKQRLLNGITTGRLGAYDIPHESIYDSSAYTGFESGLEDHNFDGYQACDDQMGIDILGGIRHLLNWRPKIGNSNKNSRTTETETRNGKRKRRSDNLSTEGHFKYRKVENNFPKIINTTLEDDTDFAEAYCAPTLNTRNQFRIPNYVYPTQTHYEMTQSGIEPKSRGSWFRPPQPVNKTVRNPTFADIEFSDDEDNAIHLQRSLGISPLFESSAIRKQPRILNIPIRQERASSSATASKQPLTTSMSRGFGMPHSMFNVNPTPRPTYAEALRLNMPFGSRADHHILNGHCGSSNSSSVSGASTSRYGNDFGMPRLNTKAMGRSILLEDREMEEHAKYKHLLDTIKRAQTNRSSISRALLSRNLTKKPRVSSKFNSPVLSHRAPLTSTVNIDDDDDEYDDVAITGVTHLKSQKIPNKREVLSTVIFDDDDNDDISEIIELNKEQRKKKIIETIDLDAKENKHDDLPYVEPVNSFRDLLSTIPHLKDNWLSIFDSKWEEKRKLRQAEVSKTLEITEKLSSERRAIESDLQERLKDFRIVDPELLVVDDFAEPEVKEEPEFPELNADRQARIKASIYGPPDQVLVEKFNMSITRRDIQTLLGHNWLNDEVINFYMNLITERSEVKQQSHGYPKVYAMNTFFLQRLSQNGHSGVKRWTRKVNIFEKDVIPVPVHVGGVHWCMAIIHLKNHWIRYYDSMGAPNPSVLKLLEQYLKDESLDKRKQPFDTTDFVIESVRDVPRQMNGSDCGVFSCMFAEYVSRNKEIKFSQEHMEYFRHKMILEIVQGELLL